MDRIHLLLKRALAEAERLDPNKYDEFSSDLIAEMREAIEQLQTGEKNV